MISDATLAHYQARTTGTRSAKQPPPLRLIPTEEQEQIALFDWILFNTWRLPQLAKAYAIPNGGFRKPREAARLVRGGVHAGVMDVHLPVARRGAHSLYLEIKALDGRISVMQIERAKEFAEEGNVVAFCWGASEAIAVLEWYLSGE